MHTYTHTHTHTNRGLKAQGKYNARSLSFVDTSFKIEQIEVEEDLKGKYDALVKVW